MKCLTRVLVWLALSPGMAGSVLAVEVGETVDNFRLLDHRGASHELRYLSDAKAIVLMVHGIGCLLVRQSLPALAELRKAFAGQGIEFLLINSNAHDDRAALTVEAKEFGIDFPILSDDTQLVGEAMGFTRTAEVFVIDPRTWRLVYRELPSTEQASAQVELR